MVSVGRGLAAAFLGLMLLLGCVWTARGLDALSWLVGLACGALLCAAVARGMGEDAPTTLGPADGVTLARALLACVLAALVTQAYVGQADVALLAVLAVTALGLDAVDGRVARRSGTSSHFGARFDGEADAFLMLVLSAYVAGSYGTWVLLIGIARYAFAVAGRVMPWLRRRLPFRYWRKVVTAAQGVVLTVAAADVLPRATTYLALLGAAALLAESFGRDVVWLWRRRSTTVAEPEAGDPVGVPLR